MLPKKAIKVICIILAALMILSAGAALLQVFAADEIVLSVPHTGDNDLDTIVPIALISLAVVAIGVCVALPKLKKKK